MLSLQFYGTTFSSSPFSAYYLILANPPMNFPLTNTHGNAGQWVWCLIQYLIGWSYAISWCAYDMWWSSSMRRRVRVDGHLGWDGVPLMNAIDGWLYSIFFILGCHMDLSLSNWVLCYYETRASWSNTGPTSSPSYLYSTFILVCVKTTAGVFATYNFLNVSGHLYADKE